MHVHKITGGNKYIPQNNFGSENLIRRQDDHRIAIFISKNTFPNTVA